MPAGGSPRVILSGSRYQANHAFRGPLCDFIILWCSDAGERAYAVELKGGGFDISKVQNQLQGGADALAVMVPADAVRFYPVLVHVQGMNTTAIKALARCRVNFSGKEYGIFTRKSGSSIERI